MSMKVTPKRYSPLAEVFPYTMGTADPPLLRLVHLPPPVGGFPTNFVEKKDYTPMSMDEKIDQDLTTYLYTRGSMRTDEKLGYFYFSYARYCETNKLCVSEDEFIEVINLSFRCDLEDAHGCMAYPFEFQTSGGLHRPDLGIDHDRVLYTEFFTASHPVPYLQEAYDDTLKVLLELTPATDINNECYDLNILDIMNRAGFPNTTYFKELIESVVSQEFYPFLQELWGGNEEDGPFWYNDVTYNTYPPRYKTTAEDEDWDPDLETVPEGIDEIPWDYGEEIAKLEADIEQSASTGGGTWTTDEYGYQSWLQNYASTGPRPTIFKKDMEIGGEDYFRLVKRKLQASIDSLHTVLGEEALDSLDRSGKLDKNALVKALIYHDSVESVVESGIIVTLSTASKAIKYINDLDVTGWNTQESPRLFYADLRPPTVDQILIQHYADCAERRVRLKIVQPRIITNKLYAKAMDYRIATWQSDNDYLSDIVGSVIPSAKDITGSGMLRNTSKTIYRVNDTSLYSRNSYEYTNLVEVIGERDGFSHLHSSPFKIVPIEGSPLYSALKRGEQLLVQKPDRSNVDKVEDKVTSIIADKVLVRSKARQLLSARQIQWSQELLNRQVIASAVGIEAKMRRTKSRSVELENTNLSRMMTTPERLRELVEQDVVSIAPTSSEAANDREVDQSSGKQVKKLLQQSLHAKVASIPGKIISKVKNKIEALDKEKEVIGFVMSDFIRRQSVQEMITDSNSRNFEDILNDTSIVFAPDHEHSGLLLPKEALRSSNEVVICKDKYGQFRVSTG